MYHDNYSDNMYCNFYYNYYDKYYDHYVYKYVVNACDNYNNNVYANHVAYYDNYYEKKYYDIFFNNVLWVERAYTVSIKVLSVLLNKTIPKNRTTIVKAVENRIPSHVKVPPPVKPNLNVSMMGESGLNFK